MSADEQMEQFFGSLTAKHAREAEPKEESVSQPVKYPRKQGKGGSGSREGGRSQGSSSVTDRRARPRAHDEEELTTLLAKMVLRQEDNTNVLRAESAMVLHMQPTEPGVLHLLIQASQEWKKQTQAPQPTVVGKMSLRVVLAQLWARELRLRLQDEEHLKKARLEGWLTSDHWVYQRWNATEKKLEVAPQPGIPHQDMLSLMTQLCSDLATTGVVHRFHSTRPMGVNQHSTLVFLLELGYRTEPAQRVVTSMQKLQRNAALQIVGSQLRPESLRRSPLAKRLAALLHPGRQPFPSLPLPPTSFPLPTSPFPFR